MTPEEIALLALAIEGRTEFGFQEQVAQFNRAMDAQQTVFAKYLPKFDSMKPRKVFQAVFGRKPLTSVDYSHNGLLYFGLSDPDFYALTNARYQTVGDDGRVTILSDVAAKLCRKDELAIPTLWDMVAIYRRDLPRHIIERSKSHEEWHSTLRRHYTYNPAIALNDFAEQFGKRPLEVSDLPELEQKLKEFVKEEMLCETLDGHSESWLLHHIQGYVKRYFLNVQATQQRFNAWTKEFMIQFNIYSYAHLTRAIEDAAAPLVVYNNKFAARGFIAAVVNTPLDEVKINLPAIYQAYAARKR